MHRASPAGEVRQKHALSRSHRTKSDVNSHAVAPVAGLHEQMPPRHFPKQQSRLVAQFPPGITPPLNELQQVHVLVAGSSTAVVEQQSSLKTWPFS